MKNEIRVVDTPIHLSEGNAPARAQQLLRVGSFRSGEVKVTADHLKQMYANFYQNARGILLGESPALPVDYYHNSEGIAGGWIKDLQLRNNDKELWAVIEFTEPAKQKIQQNEIKFLSADFNFNYVDSETGKKFGTVLKGAGLTNIPEVKGLSDIRLSEVINPNKENNKMNINEVLAFLSTATPDDKAKVLEALNAEVELSKKADMAKLSEENKSLKDENAKLKKDESVKLSESDKKLSELSTKVEDQAKEIAQLNEDKKLSEKTATFNSMLASGKASEGQRAAFMAGDMVKFAENAVDSSKVNLSEKGNGNKTVVVENPTTQAEAEDFILAKSKALASEKSITFSEARKQVTEANPTIWDLAQGTSN